MADEQSDTNSRVFALRASQWIGCSGAHKHEGKWMPCETHEELLRVSGEAEPKKKTAFEDLHKRYNTRKVKGKKKKRGWEKLNESRPLGFATLEGGGIVSAPINSTIYSGGIKSYIPGVSPRDNDPDVFTDIESARKRSRMLGCIGVRRLPSASGRTVWMPCTTNTDYARLAGTTFLGRRGQQEAQRRMIRTIVRNEFRNEERNRRIRKKSLFEELTENKGVLGRSIGRINSPGSLSRRLRRSLSAGGKIEGVLDPRVRRDVDGDGLIFDGTWREMPDPTIATTAPARALRSSGEPSPVEKKWWKSKTDNTWLTPDKIKKGGKLKASEILKFDRVRLRKNRDEQAEVLGVSREVIDAMHEPDASLDPIDADKLSLRALDLHPALIWGAAWLEPDEEKKIKIRQTRTSRGKYGSLDGRQVRSVRRGAGELDERDKKVLEMRANGATLQEIADELKVTKQRAEQIYKRAIKRNSQADERRDEGTLRSQGTSMARGDGMIRRDERGRPVRQADRRKETLEQTINKLKEIGFSDEEINLLMTGDRNTPVDTVTRDVDTSEARRLRSSGRLNSAVGLRSSGFSISLMEKTPPKEWPESSKTHMLNWANGRPSFNIPYSIAMKHKRDGDLSDRDWKTLLRFYKQWGPENNSGRRLRSSGNLTTIDAYANIGARRMAKIILDRVKPEARNKPAGRRKHYHIIGPGGMGKSTLREYLTKEGVMPDETEAALIDPDFIKVGIAGYEGGKGSELVHRESAHSATHTVNDARKEGMDIITEGTGYRLHDYKTTSDNTYEKVFHIPYLPYDVAEKRVRARNAKGQRQLPVSQIRAKGAGLYGFVTDHLRRGQAQTMYIWDMDVPEGAAPRVIAKIEDGVFVAFDEPKFKAWATQHGGRGGDSDIEWFKRNFPSK